MPSGGPGRLRELRRQLTATAGGRRQARAVVLLALVLGLNTADSATVGAVAAQLEPALHIGQAKLGLLVTVSGAIGLIAAPIGGVLADRSQRVRLLRWTIAGWAVAMLAGGVATSYTWLLGSRVLLGALIAAASPLVTSLVGDLFPTERRARVYGWILAGEIVGAGVGLFAGTSLGIISWRVPFIALAVASLALAVAVPRLLAEPDRTGSRSDLGFWAAARYILSIPTVRSIIIASAVGYFFFAGLRTFVVVYAVRRFDLPQGAVLIPAVVIGIAALVGVVGAGRIADRMRDRGHPTVRITLPALCYVGAAVIFVAALLTADIVIALLASTAGGLLLAAANPPLEAARLDIVPAGLWGRAEGVRTVLRLVGEAAAPLLFGVVADDFGGRAGTGIGLRNAFLIMLIPLALNGLILLTGRRRYLADAGAG